MYVTELLTKVNVIEVSAPKKQSAIIVTVSNLDGTGESLAVKQVEGRLEDTIKAAIAEAQAAFSVDRVESSDIEEINGPREIEEVDVSDEISETSSINNSIEDGEDAVPMDSNAPDIAENAQSVDADTEQAASHAISANAEMAIPDSGAEIDALLSDVSITETAAETEPETTVNAEMEPNAGTKATEIDDVSEIVEKVADESPKTVAEETVDVSTDIVEKEAAAPVEETMENSDVEPEDFMVTIGVHVSSPMMASECAAQLAKNSQQERKMLRQAITTVDYAKTRGGNPEIIKQASDYIAYMESKGLYKKEA